MAGPFESSSLVANKLSFYCIDDSHAGNFGSPRLLLLLRPKLSFLQIFDIIYPKGINKDPMVQVILVTIYEALSRYL